MRKRENTSKDITIGIMLVAILTMAIGYAVLQQRLNIEGTAQIKSDFSIQVTGISEFAQAGEAKTTKMSYTAASATYAADIVVPGDNIIYEIIIENKGTLSGYALIGTEDDNTDHSMTYNETVNVGVWLVSKEPLTIDENGDWVYPEDAGRTAELKPGEKLYVYSEVYFDENATEMPSFKTIENTLNFNFTQENPNATTYNSKDLILVPEMLYLDVTNATISETGIENTYDVTVTLQRIDNTNVEPSDYNFTVFLMTQDAQLITYLDLSFEMIGNSNITEETQTIRIETSTAFDDIAILSTCGDGMCYE